MSADENILLKINKDKGFKIFENDLVMYPENADFPLVNVRTNSSNKWHIYFGRMINVYAILIQNRESKFRRLNFLYYLWSLLLT